MFARALDEAWAAAPVALVAPQQEPEVELWFPAVPGPWLVPEPQLAVPEEPEGQLASALLVTSLPFA